DTPRRRRESFPRAGDRDRQVRGGVVRGHRARAAGGATLCGHARRAPRGRERPLMPTVSVIMPAYNARHYLHGAVESVLRQTFRDLALLVIDDGSSDETVRIAEDFAGRDPRVRVLRQENAGPGPARNTGFRHARGHYFAFLDSDDEWDDTFLAEQVAVLELRPDVDVVIGNARHRGGKRDGRPCRPIRGEGLPITLAESPA